MGGRGSTGGNNPGGSKDTAAKRETKQPESRVTANDKQKEFDEMRGEVAIVGYGKKYSDLTPAEKYEVDKSLVEAANPGEYAGVKMAPKPVESKKVTPVKEKKKGDFVRAQSNRAIEGLTDKLASNTDSTIIGTKGNTTYVVEADRIRVTRTLPNGVRVPASRTVYSVTPFVKGRSSADTQTFRNSQELNDYMKATGANWK